MKLFRPLAALFFSTCIIASQSVSPAHAIGQATASPSASGQGGQVLMQAVREAVRHNPALADGAGNQALLVGVRNAVIMRPELTESILAAAKSLRPNLASHIDQVAMGNAQAMAVPQPAPAVPVGTIEQAVPKPLGGGLGNAALLGLAGVVAGSVGVIAATGGGDSSSAAGFVPTEEYENQWGLQAIKAGSAYARGATGSGVTVAVLDSGLLTTHADIANNVLPNGYNVYDHSSDVTDNDGHGTHVSGIVAAQKDGSSGDANMHGVAYNADILPVRILNYDEYLGISYGTAAGIITGVNYATAQNAQVLNGSYGPDYSDPVNSIQVITNDDLLSAAAYQAAADSGMVLVFAAGNEYGTNPSVAANPTGMGIYPYITPANANSGVYTDGGANYDFSGLEGMLLAVVATEQDGSIASYSNRCGVAANWCIAAPGSSILSLAETGGYTTKSGTSMAAPHVSGAVAVLIDMFPELTPEEIVERILATANKTGIYVDASVYGQGFLDLDKATRPIGSLSVATGASVHDGQNYALDKSNMNLGPAFGDGLRAALVGQKLAVFDQQNATFVVDLADFTHSADNRFHLDDALRRFRSRFGAKTIQLAEGASLSYTLVDLGKNDSVRSDPSLSNKEAVMEMAYSQNIAGVQWNMHYNINPSVMFGIYKSEGVDSNALLSRDAFSAPYLSFAKQGYSMGSHVALTDGLSVSAASFQGYPLADEMRAPEERAESFGHLVELAYKTGALKVFTQMGMLTEKQTFLGSRTEGAFDLDSGTHTSFAGLNSAYRLSPHWSLVGSYYLGHSAPQLDSHSLFNDISDVQTESFSIGMMGQDILHKGDAFGVLGNQPLRVTGGEASLSLANGRSRSGVLYKQDYQVNLAPTGRELNMEAFYHFNLPATQTQLMSSLLYRTEPGHIETAPDEGVVLLQLQQPF